MKLSDLLAKLGYMQLVYTLPPTVLNLTLADIRHILSTIEVTQ